MTAYDHYLLGRYNLNKRTQDGIDKAVFYFKNAIRSDPEFAEAYSGLADCYLLSSIGYAPIINAASLARTAADKALSLNSNLSDPYVSLGYLHLNIDWSFEKAYGEFQKALELNPNNVRAYQWLAHYYLYKRLYDRGVIYLDRAREIEPLSPLIATEQAWPHMYMGDYKTALSTLQQAISLDNRFFLSHFNLGQVYFQQGLYDKSLAEFNLSIQLSMTPIAIAHKALCLIKMDQFEEAKECLDELLRLNKINSGISSFIGAVYDALGDVDEAKFWFENAIENNEPFALHIDTISIPIENVKSMPSFNQILLRLLLKYHSA